MGFKKQAVIADVYHMSTSKSIRYNDKVGDPFLTNRIFSLDDASKINSNYQNKRRWVEVNWEETAKLQLEANNLDWLDYALSEKELECKALKRKIKFPLKDSYTEAIEDGEELEKYNDYILAVEAEIEVIKNIEFKPKPVVKEVSEGEVTIESLKAIIKEEGLGVRVSKDDSIESVQAKMEEARAKK